MGDGREAEFPPSVLLDTDLRKLHSEGRTSDAMRRIREFEDLIRARVLQEAQQVAIGQSNFGHVEGNRRAFLIASLLERRMPIIADLGEQHREDTTHDR